MSFPKIFHQKGYFGPLRKKSVISLLSTDSRYFRTYALNNWSLGKRLFLFFLRVSSVSGDEIEGNMEKQRDKESLENTSGPVITYIMILRNEWGHQKIKIYS